MDLEEEREITPFCLQTWQPSLTPYPSLVPPVQQKPHPSTRRGLGLCV